jgi:phosphoribosylaminoimidazole (AIR) synthetase
VARLRSVAVVTDGALADIMPRIADHFVHAQVQHFASRRVEEAWNWINQKGKAQLDPAA